ncbi:Cochaperone protein [Komagataella phaffii CBS 7435]|uniref:Cochaperone protein n=2 Tax=Komagataella phaffii TaxID=460519 RepID=F2QTC1_KOMPC|nr:putative cochaperone, regulates activity of Cyr1p (adenylyl cyclase) [Komagataella phaffii GS115]AOA62356.1 GQ67_00371T0 [Komagataella phaffii]CAH2448542.1 Cochaperone protein [Komagataella phaffii CBS 7435]AOA67958.1 GQ68_01018T0 [Komagataella phaffii GS115]CAY68949.1 Probable cochaperone, regulates activity of Cyr1p (adenylyl cyclase) [Komagataella phaffii GS115]CCA38649.1 Cochaperone protein [Komagataella phaffii CBS 7435]
MTLESLISSGVELIEQGNYLKAIDQFSRALQLSDSSFKAYLNRSIAYQRSQKLDLALKDVDQAIHIAKDLRQSQEYISASYFRKAIILYLLKNYAESYQNILLAQKYHCSDITFPSWKSKIEAKLDSEKSKPVQSVPDSSKAEKPSANEKPLQPTTPSIASKPRIDWYQNSTEVNISIFVKKIDKSSLKVDFAKDSLEVSFPLPDSGEDYTYKIEKLFAKIDPSQSSYTVFGTKLELTLQKIEPIQWNSIEFDQQRQPSTTHEESTLAYPSSSKKKIDWSKLGDDEDEAKDDQSPDAFFQQLYKNADDDSKKAMMKSFIESGGKSLSTNWDNVENKDFSAEAEP